MILELCIKLSKAVDNRQDDISAWQLTSKYSNLLKQFN